MLSKFMRKNVKGFNEVELVVGNRFVDDNGKPIPIRLREIKGEDLDNITAKYSNVSVDEDGKPVVDTKSNLELARAIIVKSVVFPDLNNANLQDDYGVMTPEDLVGELFTGAEYNKIRNKAFEINGMTQTDDEQVEIAKN